jgi:hypothetical protein
MSTSDLWLLALEAWDRLAEVYGPAMAHAAVNEAGLAEGTYFGWMLAAPGFEPDPISAGRLAGRAPYTAQALNDARLADGAEQGLLRPAGEGEYYLTEAGRTAARRIFEAAYHVMTSLQPLPAAEMSRLADLLRRLVEACVAAPEPPGKYCLRLSRRIVPSDAAPALAWIDQYLSDLNFYRDDAHMASWKPYGIGGAAWEAFTYLWRGEARTLDELWDRLAFRGHARQDYADALEDLAVRGWIAAEGDGGSPCGEKGCRLTDAGRAVREAAEQTTDAYFFAPWACLGEGELGELRALLTGLRDGLPKNG